MVAEGLTFERAITIIEFVEQRSHKRQLAHAAENDLKLKAAFRKAHDNLAAHYGYEKARHIILEALPDEKRDAVAAYLVRRGPPKGTPKTRCAALSLVTIYELFRRMDPTKTDRDFFRHYIEVFLHRDPNDENEIDRCKHALDRALKRLGKPKRKDLRTTGRKEFGGRHL
jgi:hypothetical protein